MALAIFSLILMVQISYQTVSPSCCVKKTVGEHSYTLTDKPPDVSTDICLEQCFYNRDCEEENVYCFLAGGTLNSTCNDDTTPEPDVVFVSGGGSGSGNLFSSRWGSGGSGFGCEFDFGSGSGLGGGSGFGSGFEFGSGFGFGCGFEYEVGSGFVEGFGFGSGPQYF